ncbi:ABC transporter permease [Leucobacter sp. CSA1]|uniref:ABC transporter permease n=1 Tax=Leucobacter chromiisoli TaxID=2796471 RepID=A0A934Q829_9MICO|nr:ABC transporter permease [Leucobacter chromiisoli]MBK0419050.1 ABC transporter permease [Leucobacter chromiisoli]
MRPASTSTRTDAGAGTAVRGPGGAIAGAGGSPEGVGPRLRRILLRQDTALLLVLLIMVAFFTVMNPLFLSRPAFATILQDWAPVMLLAIGQTYVIMTAGIDLSVGSTLGLSGVTGALVIRALTEGGQPAAIAIAVGVVAALLVGAVVGVVNGLLITRVGLAPFIATLATMGAGAGMTLVVTRGVQIAGGPSEVIALGTTKFLGLVTVPLIVVFVVLAIAWVVMEQTQFGRWTQAIGSNGFASRGAGINVNRHLMKVYVLSGVTAALGGLFVYFRLGSGSPTSGLGFELQAIAAVVIGGTSLFGGSGRMSGTVLGALITTSVLSGLILIGVGPYWQQVVVGVLIAGAVGVQQLSSVRQSRGASRG